MYLSHEWHKVFAKNSLSKQERTAWILAFAEVQMGPLFFWKVTQRRFVVSYGSFGTDNFFRNVFYLLMIYAA